MPGGVKDELSSDVLGQCCEILMALFYEDGSLALLGSAVGRSRNEFSSDVPIGRAV